MLVGAIRKYVNVLAEYRTVRDIGAGVKWIEDPRPAVFDNTALWLESPSLDHGNNRCLGDCDRS